MLLGDLYQAGNDSLLKNLIPSVTDEHYQLDTQVNTTIKGDL